MRIIIISQVFWPDTVSVAQQMWDFSQYLVKSGHNVTVFASRYSYESSKVATYKANETIHTIKVCRVKHANFSKNFILGRLLNMITFNISIFFKLLIINNKEFDLIFGTTVPPLLSFFGLIVAKIKKIPYCYWIMDLQPELAIQSGLIKKTGVLASILYEMSGFILKKANLVIVLDRFMGEYVKKIRSGKICISPVWSVADGKYESQFINNKFRVDNEMGNRIVVMYSGNHAYIHPLDTLLGAALRLKNNDKFLFVFIGDGVRRKDVTEFKNNNKLSNILQIPFQPRENIHNSLSAANLHVVIIGEGQVGFTHPSKIYGALDVGRPIIYIGPSPSHVDDILQNLPGNINIHHGQTNLLVDKLLDFSHKSQEEISMIGERNRLYWLKHFNPEISKRNMTDAIEGIC